MLNDYFYISFFLFFRLNVSFFLLNDSLCVSLAANPLTSTFFHTSNPFQEAGLFSDHFFSTKESQTKDEKKNVFLLITVDNYTSADKSPMI